MGFRLFCGSVKVNKVSNLKIKGYVNIWIFTVVYEFIEFNSEVNKYRPIERINFCY